MVLEIELCTAGAQCSKCELLLLSSHHEIVAAHDTHTHTHTHVCEQADEAKVAAIFAAFANESGRVEGDDRAHALYTCCAMIKSLPTKTELDGILGSPSWDVSDLQAAVAKVPVEGRFEASPFAALAGKFPVTAIPVKYLKKVLTGVADELEPEEFAAFIAFADEAEGAETINCEAFFSKLSGTVFA